MPGASEQTRQVKIVNANWVPGEEGQDGRFEVMFITEDDERHVVTASPASVSALVELTQAPTILMWDPDGPTLIAANVVGKMPGQTGSSVRPASTVRCKTLNRCSTPTANLSPNVSKHSRAGV